MSPSIRGAPADDRPSSGVGGWADALVRSGRTRREAEWLALVCLHSGMFLRSQHLAFIGRTNPALANRFVRRCRKHAVEQLDYVLEDPHAVWLPTEDEKVNALTGARIAEGFLPRRLYQGLPGAVGVQYRYPFTSCRWPSRNGGRRFCSCGPRTRPMVRSARGGQHAALWAALAAAGRAVDVVVGRDPVRLAAADWPRSSRRSRRATGRPCKRTAAGTPPSGGRASLGAACVGDRKSRGQRQRGAGARRRGVAGHRPRAGRDRTGQPDHRLGPARECPREVSAAS